MKGGRKEPHYSHSNFWEFVAIKCSMVVSSSWYMWLTHKGVDKCFASNISVDPIYVFCVRE